MIHRTDLSPFTPVQFATVMPDLQKPALTKYIIDFVFIFTRIEHTITSNKKTSANAQVKVSETAHMSYTRLGSG